MTPFRLYLALELLVLIALTLLVAAILSVRLADRREQDDFGDREGRG